MLAATFGESVRGRASASTLLHPRPLNQTADDDGASYAHRIPSEYENEQADGRTGRRTSSRWPMVGGMEVVDWWWYADSVTNAVTTPLFFTPR